MGVERRLRVLHVVHELDYGGLQRLVGNIAQRIDCAAFETHILTLGDFGPLARGLERHATLHRVRAVPRLSMLWPRRLVRTMRRLAPDVVHTHSGVWYKASLAARRAGVPLLVHTDHGRPQPDPLLTRLLERRAARRTHVVVAVSEALRHTLAAIIAADPAQLRVVVNGVDTVHFRPRPPELRLRNELGLPADAPVIGSVGRLDAIKAHDVMIAAFARLRRSWAGERPPVLLLVGDGPERSGLAALIEREGLRDAVRLVGPRSDVEVIYPLLDVFTLSSWSEGTSLGLLEAMSSGVCPVATAVGGTPAVLGPSLRHRLVPAGNPATLAEAWGAALTDAGQRACDGAIARRRVEQGFGIDAVVRQYEAIYTGAA